jgi:hypothetical protein
MSKYKWTDDMREISGFGGGYEATCRAMVTAGLEWFDSHPQADPRFHGYQNITGIIIDDNNDAKELSAAMTDKSITNGDCTGAMHQFSMMHVFRIRKIGWERYCKESRAIKDVDDPQKANEILAALK